MYYIRTKDTIFAVVREDAKVLTVRAKNNPNHLYNKSKAQTEIVMQANTIEELCDERVIIDAIGNHILVKTLLQEIWWKQHDEEHVQCFGAIWVIDSNDAPTLKSIAKMNEQGKLELL